MVCAPLYVAIISVEIDYFRHWVALLAVTPRAAGQRSWLLRRVSLRIIPADITCFYRQKCCIGSFFAAYLLRDESNVAT